eukprot:m.286100 g.286100  ORF g.286100 m.286100 type:complete len:201 (+) comp54981_c0_seq5:1053-1655(+)
MSAATDSIASLSSTLKFLLTIGRLKTEKRTGWVRSNVHLPESISDHMYRMALIAFACGSRSGVNTDKCIKMALVHDLAECVVGDITPDCGVTKEEKQQRELAAMRGLCEMLEPTVAQEFMSLFLEYEAGTSPDAMFVKDIDKFEMVLQAYEYEQAEKRPGGLPSFFRSTEGKVRDAQLKALDAEIRGLRPAPAEHQLRAE